LSKVFISVGLLGEVLNLVISMFGIGAGM